MNTNDELKQKIITSIEWLEKLPPSKWHEGVVLRVKTGLMPLMKTFLNGEHVNIVQLDEKPRIPTGEEQMEVFAGEQK